MIKGKRFKKIWFVAVIKLIKNFINNYSFFSLFMKKRVDRSKLKLILLTVAAVLFVLFVVFPLFLFMIGDSKQGNVALISIEGEITENGGQGFSTSSVSSREIVQFIEDADANPEVQVLLLDINSPGGSAVASDEIAAAVKKSSKPVVALIREAGASGAYWIASSTDYVVANRMSITGSIGVISSYLEFSGLMEKYGVGYEQLTAGERKDLGTPFKKLTDQDKNILQQKLNRIHEFFIEEVAANRNLEISQVKKIATGEFFLGEEALKLGLVDQLGGKDDAENLLREKFGLQSIEYVKYEHSGGFFELLSGVISNFFFNVGEGIGSMLVAQQHFGISLM